VANTLKLYRNGAVGFIVWLDRLVYHGDRGYKIRTSRFCSSLIFKPLVSPMRVQ